MEWIDVNKELPKIGSKVLIWVRPSHLSQSLLNDWSESYRKGHFETDVFVFNRAEEGGEIFHGFEPLVRREYDARSFEIESENNGLNKYVSHFMYYTEPIIKF